jgi:hypothetical protein
MLFSPQVRIVDRFQLHALIVAGAAFVLAIVTFIEYTVLCFENCVLIGMVCHVAPPAQYLAVNQLISSVVMSGIVTSLCKSLSVPLHPYGQLSLQKPVSSMQTLHGASVAPQEGHRVTP